jgi:hypothetical protein
MNATTINEIINTDCPDILKKNKLRSVTISEDGNSYTVESASGSTYTVAYAGCTDDGHGNLWECDCPAGQHGRQCRHLKAVLAIQDDLADECCWG